MLAVAILLGAAYATGMFDRFDSPARVTATLVALGPWGYVAFVATYAALQPFGIPGTVFVMAAPLIWPWPLAFALSMTGTMLASVVGFSFARLVAARVGRAHHPCPLPPLRRRPRAQRASHGVL